MATGVNWGPQLWCGKLRTTNEAFCGHWGRMRTMMAVGLGSGPQGCCGGNLRAQNVLQVLRII